jgi:hypothetical protein
MTAALVGGSELQRPPIFTAESLAHEDLENIAEILNSCFYDLITSEIRCAEAERQKRIDLTVTENILHYLEMARR